MKKAVLAIDPTAMEKPWFPRVAQILKRMQRRGEIGEISVVSVIHPNAFLLPWSWYQSMKQDLTDEVMQNIRDGFEDLLSINSIHVQTSSSYMAEDIADAVLHFKNKEDADLVILIHDGRSKLSKFFFGSVIDEVGKRSQNSELVIHPSAPRGLVSLALGIEQPV